jgi:hypothetical protein
MSLQKYPNFSFDKSQNSIINKCLVSFIILLLICYVIYLFCDNITNDQNKKIYEYFNTTVVLLKTHTWNDELENFAIKIINETIPNKIDFYILMHSDDFSLPKKIKNSDLKKYVSVFEESDIKNIYKQGFFSICTYSIENLLINIQNG